MVCCSTPASAPVAPEYAPEIDQSADHLATLLSDTPEYQEFTRLARFIHLDPDVKRILLEIRNRQMFTSESASKSIEDLQAELEALPAVQAYRKVEAALKDLFHSVDQVISLAAGVEFAPNALPSSCG